MRTVYIKYTLQHWISSSVLVIILHRWKVLYLSIILQVMNSYVNTYCLFSYLFQPELSSNYRRWKRRKTTSNTREFESRNDSPEQLTEINSVTTRQC